MDDSANLIDLLEKIDTVIIGGGQAGLATSFYLKKQGCEHLVMERADRPGAAWQVRRSITFTLITPELGIPPAGHRTPGDDRDGFMPATGSSASLIAIGKRRYRFASGLTSRQSSRWPSALVASGQPGDGCDFEVQNVVVATGMDQSTKITAFGLGLPTDIVQLHSGQYRDPASLPPGAVLVVGSGQSGCRIAEELYQSGRRVYLCVGGAGRAPRQYRSKDAYAWLDLTGFLDRTPDKLPSPRANVTPNPHVFAAGGGHTLNLHRFARDGVTLFGHLHGAANGRLDSRPNRMRA